MHMRLPQHMNIQQWSQQSGGFIPQLKVYEDVPIEPARWEYKVLTIDIVKDTLPDEDQLNELGKEGWLLNGVLNQGKSGGTSLVHYYFMRQITK